MDTPITPEQTAPEATPVPQESPEPVNTATTSSTQEPEAAEAPTSSQDAPEEAQEAPEPQPPKPRKVRLRRAQQRRRLHNVILAGVFLLFLLVCFIVNLAVKDRIFPKRKTVIWPKSPPFLDRTNRRQLFLRTVQLHQRPILRPGQMDVPQAEVRNHHGPEGRIRHLPGQRRLSPLRPGNAQ